ncbi:hypothetical protein JT06_17935 [Desulfobulbus sp. Tol-SR]|jgi:phage/conjugal plasmid C-4 type zinc finger TraR family protein|nr:hypothetical protein JT06_17935 [Desulfobulbus sp. Tol-SR]
MADQLDRAWELSEMHLREALAHCRPLQGESRTHCLECDAPIPEGRRKAAPGCQYCVQCAAELGG